MVWLSHGALVETLESDLAKFESWAINGVGSEAALNALKYRSLETGTVSVLIKERCTRL